MQLNLIPQERTKPSFDRNEYEYYQKYSRLLAVVGHKGLRALQSSKILIIGAKGLGIEIAKNLVLMGVSGVYIRDDRIISPIDISTSVLFKQEDIGKNIADIVPIRLAEISKDVQAQIHRENSFLGFDLVCLTEATSEDDINHINTQCRAHGTPLVVGETFGVFGLVFNDFNEHLVQSNENDEWYRSCYAVHLPKKLTMQFSPFSQFLSHKLTPQKVLCQDTTQAHVFLPILRSLMKFRQQHGRDPRPWNVEESNVIVEQAKQFESDLDEKFVTRVAQVSSVALAPVISVIGGTMTHEIIKALTHRGSPVDQFMFYECSDVLPQVPPTLGSLAEMNASTQYDGLVTLFGLEAVKKIRQSQVLVIGAGSVGCEVLKILATLGVGSEDSGSITIAEKKKESELATICGYKIARKDKSTVELPHLCSQMLYRLDDLSVSESRVILSEIADTNKSPKKDKAEVAAERIRQMSNKKSKVTTSTTSIGDLETVMSSHDVVINASPERVQVEDYVLRFEKPLIDCAISGTKGHVGVIFPHVTSNDVVQVQMPEAPYDSLYTRPKLFRHCAVWAQTCMFERRFCRDIQDFQNPQSYMAEIDAIPLDTTGCMQWGLQEFNSRFHGSPSSTNQLPKPLTIDHNDPLHVTFVLTAAKLIAQAMGIVPTRQFNRELLEEVLKCGEDTASEGLLKGTVQTLAREVQERSFKLNAIHHDVEGNAEHLAMIHTAALLWARAFGISEEEPAVHTLMAVNNRNPKIISTASIVAGLAAIEFLKIRTKNDIQLDTFRNSFINTHAPIMVQFHPITPIIRQFKHISFTVWDKIEIDEGDLTLQQLLNYFKLKYDLDALVISVPTYDMPMYSFFRPVQPDLLKKVSDHFKAVTRNTTADCIELDLFVDEPDGVNITLPRFFFRWQNSSLPCETWLTEW